MMKEYGDEIFIRYLQERQEEARERDIRKGSILSGGKIMVFKEREVLKRQMWMWMPEDFAILSREIARLKYPYENRPNIIFTNKEATVNVNFTHRQEKMGRGREEEIRDHMERIVKQLYPSCEVIEKQSTAAGENCLAWFDFVTPAVDTEIYNLMFFTPVKGRLLTGSCNCMTEDQEEWKELFVQMLATVRMA